MIFLLLFGILAATWQLWLFAWTVAAARANPNANFRVSLVPGILSVLLIGAWFMLT